MRAAWLVVLLAGFATAGRGGEGPPPSRGHVEIRAGDLRLVLADNQAYGEIHRAGYNGVAEVDSGDSGRSLFVPSYAGLNLEHIFSGDAASYDTDEFEPRLAPMQLVRVTDTRYDLRQEFSREFSGVEDIVRTYEAWSGEAVERPPSAR